MWPFKKDLWGRLSRSGKLYQPMQCGTPSIWLRKEDPVFFFRCAYEQADGSTIVEDIYPHDGRREMRVVPKGQSLT